MIPPWQKPPKELILLSDELHIWYTDLDLPQEEIEKLAKILSEDEINRANRFVFPHHRKHFIVARSTLRIILSSYVRLSPEQIQFNYSPKGKPSMAPSCNQERITFNLSHSDTLALYGIRRGHPIGVDIEYMRPMEDVDKLAQRFFSPREYGLIASLSSPDKENTFFRFWTAKEAFLKATGDGISGGLNQIELDLGVDGLIRFLRIHDDTQMVANWSLFPITIGYYIGAVVTQGGLRQILYYQK